MSLSDPFKSKVDFTLDSPLSSVGDGIYVWTAGNLNFTDNGGKVHGTYAVVAGQLIPWRVTQINTGTDAVIEVGTH